MLNKLFVKIFNRTCKYKSVLLTCFYKKLFRKAGSMKVWGRIKVVYPQNVSIGDNCSINPGVFINAYNPIVIGDNVTISANSMLVSTGIDLDKWMGSDNGDKHIKNDGIRIGDHVWIGANSMILGGGNFIR